MSTNVTGMAEIAEAAEAVVLPEEMAIKRGCPAKVLITGGRGIGGVTSFAEGLRSGFNELGIPAEVIPPSRVFSRWRELRDPRILKILSTTAVFAAPVACRAICIAHGVARAYHQSLAKMALVNSTFKLANACRGTQLIAVSDYAANHLRIIFNVRIDAVVRNPMRPLFLEKADSTGAERSYITYAGRLDPIKNLHRLLPAICDILDENPNLQACIIGDGRQRAALESLVPGNSRIEFTGARDAHFVRERLRRTVVFVSGDVAEPFGIVYLEALSQGCAVAMPASGGGLEIAPELFGRGIHLFSASLARDSVAAALRNALNEVSTGVSLAAYTPCAVAKAYLAADARFSRKGIFQAVEAR